MKKVLLRSALPILVLFMVACNKGSEKDVAGKQQQPCRGDSTLFNQKNAYLNLDPHNFYIDKEKKGFLPSLLLRFDPHDKSEYRRDSAKFYTQFIQSGLLTNSASFPYMISDMYTGMQNDLGLQAIHGYDDNDVEFLNGMRVYPAISTNMGGQKTLYLVFVGERSTYNGGFQLTWASMLDKDFYAIKNGTYAKLTAAEKTQANTDMVSFRTFWATYYPSYVPRSYMFSISEYLSMLDNNNLGLISGLSKPAKQYGIVFYPCIKSDSLIFVAKGFDKATGSFHPLENKFFYDNMDVCPTKCPDTELK